MSSERVRTALHTRFSSAEQRERQSIALQRDFAEACCQRAPV